MKLEATMSNVKNIVNCHRVLATRNIVDSPCSRTDASAKRGDVGTVEDVILFDDLIVVDFGSGAILCDASEVEPA